MDEIIEALRTVLQNRLGSTYRYYYGRPNAIQEQALPAICIAPVATTQTLNGTGDNNFVYSIVIEVSLIVSIKAYMSTAPVDQFAIMHTKDIVQKIEARDPTNRVPNSATILKAINDDLAFDSDSLIMQWADSVDPIEISYNEVAQQLSGSYLVPAVLRLRFNQNTPGCPQ